MVHKICDIDIRLPSDTLKKFYSNLNVDKESLSKEIDNYVKQNGLFDYAAFLELSTKYLTFNIIETENLYNIACQH